MRRMKSGSNPASQIDAPPLPAPIFYFDSRIYVAVIPRINVKIYSVYAFTLYRFLFSVNTAKRKSTIIEGYIKTIPKLFIFGVLNLANSCSTMSLLILAER